MHNLGNPALLPHREMIMSPNSFLLFGDIINYQKSLLYTLPGALATCIVVEVKQCFESLCSFCQSVSLWLLWGLRSSNDTDHDQLLTEASSVQHPCVENNLQKLKSHLWLLGPLNLWLSISILYICSKSRGVKNKQPMAFLVIIVTSAQNTI